MTVPTLYDLDARAAHALGVKVVPVLRAMAKIALDENEPAAGRVAAAKIVLDRAMGRTFGVKMEQAGPRPHEDIKVFFGPKGAKGTYTSTDGKTYKRLPDGEYIPLDDRE